MREAQTKDINGRRYAVLPLAAGPGLKLFTKVGRLVGPALEKVTTLGQARTAIFAAFGMVLERLDENDLDQIARVLAKESKVQGEKGMIPLDGVFDEHFRGDMGSLFLWLAFALEVNFGPLWDALGLRRAAPDGSAAAAR
jgi:hypothetical protein